MQLDRKSGHVAVMVPEVDEDGPVSYTHLRAHETVLDLVCRLLLEKKKTIEQRATKSDTIVHRSSATAGFSY